MSNENTALFALENCTLAALIESGAEYLDSSDLVYGHGTDNPLDESAWLALEACGLSPAEPLESYEIPVTAAQLQQAQRWFRLRAGQQIPVAYITGRSWFAGLEFVTDPRALIPRSPIAELIANEFQPWLVKPPAAVLDLCCGGGCIAIATAVAFPSALVHASDLSADALQLAEINRARHGLEQLQLFQGDLFEPLPGGQRYDLIVSNPPHVDAQDMRELANEFKHEPSLGLAAGGDGLDIVARMLDDAGNYLTDDGVLIIEVGNSQPAVEERFGHLEPLWLEFAGGGDGVFILNAQALRGAVP